MIFGREKKKYRDTGKVEVDYPDTIDGYRSRDQSDSSGGGED